MAVGINEAASLLEKNPATIRRWIAEGAPCVSPGEAGRGHGAVVDIDALLRWRHGVKQRDEAEMLKIIAAAMLDFFKRDSGIGEPAHRTIGIRDREAAALYVLLYEYIAQRNGHGAEPLPDEIARIRAVCVR